MKKILVKYWPLLIILGLSFLITWPILLPGYFSHHDDLQVMRIFEMRKCLEDLQIPCRWVPDMGYGNGFPLFNYYGVLPYYIGAILSYFFGFIGAAKVLFFAPLIFGGVTMYLLSEMLGGKWVGLTAGTLYMFAPFRALDTYVRGAIGESFALALLPLIFYFGLKLAREKANSNFIFFTLSLGFFLITHNIMTMLFAPILVLFILYVRFCEKIKNIKLLLTGVALGIGLASFFLLPAFLEKNLVQTDNLTSFDLDFRAHFVTVKQLFLDRDWGYGASTLGPQDTISFQIGWPHWWLVILGLLISFKIKKILPLFFIFLVSIFMMHNKSAFVWEKIGILRYTQFPWRFLSLAIFSSSLLGGLGMIFLRKDLQKYLAILIVLLTVILNFNYFKPKEFYFKLTDKEKLSGSLWEEQQRAVVSDFLPKGAYQPQERAPSTPKILGDGVIKDFIVKSNTWQFNATIKQTSQIEVPIFDFPNWQVLVNGQKIDHNNNNLLKRIQFDLKAGQYQVRGKLKDTPIRTISNLLTLISFAGLIFLTYGKKINKS